VGRRVAVAGALLALLVSGVFVGQGGRGGFTPTGHAPPAGGGAPVLGVDFPVGTYIFDWQAEHDSPIYTDQQGWDGTEHGEFTADKAALVADLSTVSVGLIGGAQPDTLSTTPDDGNCPDNADSDGGGPDSAEAIYASDVANLPTVTLTGVGTVPLVRNCDWRSIEQRFVLADDLAGIAVVNSRLGQVVAQGAGMAFYAYDSLLEGFDDNDNGSIGSYTLNTTSDAGTYVGWSELVGGSDVLKLGDNHHLAWTHLHGYRNTCDPATYQDPDDCSPHFDTIQCQGSCVGSSLLAINSEGPFRTSQQPARMKFAGGTVGDLLVAHSAFSGGRAFSGNGPMTIGDSGGSWDSSGSGDAAVCSNIFIGADDSRGISWCRGPVLDFQTPVPDGAAHASGNTASDGNTSGTSGQQNGTPCSGDKTTDWRTTDASAATGTVRACEQAHYDAAAARLATHVTWRAELRGAAGLPAPGA